MVGGSAIEDIEYQDGQREEMRLVNKLSGMGPLRARSEAAQGEGSITRFSSFQEDSERLNQNRKDAGFSHNIPNGANNRNTTWSPNLNSDYMLGSPAIRSFVGKRDKLEQEQKTNAGGDSQFFPFCFSTLNKQNRYEICYLQGTLASLNEQYTPSWSPKSFIGRSEQVYTYTMSTRVIDMSFSVFADTGRNLQNVYERVLWLAQQVYPDYDKKKSLKDGPMVALRIGDLFPYQEGFITSLSYDWNMLGAGGKWEVTPNKRIPQGCTISLGFQPIHRRVPSREFNFYSSATRSMANKFVQDDNFNSEPYTNPPHDYADMENLAGTKEQYYLAGVESGRTSDNQETKELKLNHDYVTPSTEKRQDVG